MNNVICNGARSCGETECPHKTRHMVGSGCNGKCQNTNYGIYGSSCIKTIEL